MQIDPQNNRYPYCLVWTALPCLTCCLPCIGHTGICKSDGTIFDFIGKGPMHHGQMAFGSPLKYLLLDHSNYNSDEWDEAIEQANKLFSITNHNLITNNCHHHVAEVLNQLNYKDYNQWNQVDICWLAFKSHHLAWYSYYIYLFIIIIIIIMIIL